MDKKSFIELLKAKGLDEGSPVPLQGYGVSMYQTGSGDSPVRVTYYIKNDIVEAFKVQLQTQVVQSPEKLELFSLVDMKATAFVADEVFF